MTDKPLFDPSTPISVRLNDAIGFVTEYSGPYRLQGLADEVEALEKETPRLMGIIKNLVTRIEALVRESRGARQMLAAVLQWIGREVILPESVIVGLSDADTIVQWRDPARPFLHLTFRPAPPAQEQGAETPDRVADPQDRTMMACPLCHRENCQEHGPIAKADEDPSDAEVNVWVDEPPVEPEPEEEPAEEADASPRTEDRWTDRKDIA